MAIAIKWNVNIFKSSKKRKKENKPLMAVQMNLLRANQTDINDCFRWITRRSRQWQCAAESTRLNTKKQQTYQQQQLQKNEPKQKKNPEYRSETSGRRWRLVGRRCRRCHRQRTRQSSRLKPQQQQHKVSFFRYRNRTEETTRILIIPEVVDQAVCRQVEDLSWVVVVAHSSAAAVRYVIIRI